MIFFVLIISLIVRIWYVIIPTIIWWDTAMYVGIGKYIFSGGVIGIWEPFRPILLPLILGSVWKIGLDPLIVGKILMVIAGLALIWFTYKIGEAIEEHSGVYAAILVGFTPMTIMFTNYPLTDVPSTLFTVIAFYLIITKKYFWSGITLALAFLFRFPQILAVVPLAASIWLLSEKISDVRWKEYLKNNIKNTLLFGIGAAVLIVPFLISNYIQFQDPLYPITAGSTVAAQSVHAGPQDYLYYVKGLVGQNPLLIFAIVPLILLAFKRNVFPHTKIILAILLFIIILGGYFSHTRHQEVRYGLAFLPYVALLAGYGFTHIIRRLQERFAHHIAVVAITFVMLGVCGYVYHNYSSSIHINPDYKAYISYFKDMGNQTLMTSSPQVVAFSNVSIKAAPSTWEHADKIFDEVKTQVTFIALNTCELVCEDPVTCPNARVSVTNKIEQQTRIFYKEIYDCKLYILEPKQ